MYKRYSCVVCDHGEVFFFYKNEDAHCLRIESYDCTLCNNGLPYCETPEEGECLISQGEFYELIEKGWGLEP
jgi:hypothetical protein